MVSLRSMRTFDELDDPGLEALLRDMAFKLDAELWVSEQDVERHPWIAAFKKYDLPAELAPAGAILRSAEAPTKREALVGLAQQDDIDQMLRQ